MMRTVVLQFEVPWSDRKIMQTRGDIMLDIQQWGAKNVQWHVKDSEVPEVKVLVLECSKCFRPGRPKRGEKRGHLHWEAQNFTPCPKCNRRDTVKKVDSRVEEAA